MSPWPGGGGTEGRVSTQGVPTVGPQWWGLRHLGLQQWGTRGHPSVPSCAASATSCPCPHRRAVAATLRSAAWTAEARRPAVAVPSPSSRWVVAVARGHGWLPALPLSPHCPLSPELPAEAQWQLPEQGVEEEIRDPVQQRPPLLPPQHQRECPRPPEVPKGWEGPVSPPLSPPGLHPQHAWEGDGSAPHHSQGSREAPAPRHLRLRPLGQHQRAAEGPRAGG